MTSSLQCINHRRFERITRMAEGDVLQLTPSGNALHRAVTRDVSAAGLRLSTTEAIIPPALFLAHVSDEILKNLRQQDFLHMGDDYLARCVWVKKIPTSGLYEVGARFLSKSECSDTEFSLFQDLINFRTLTEIHP